MRALSLCHEYVASNLLWSSFHISYSILALNWLLFLNYPCTFKLVSLFVGLLGFTRASHNCHQNCICVYYWNSRTILVSSWLFFFKLYIDYYIFSWYHLWLGFTGASNYCQQAWKFGYYWSRERYGLQAVFFYNTSELSMPFWVCF